MIEFFYRASAYYTGAVNNTLGLRTIAKFDPGAAISIIGLMRFKEDINNQTFLDFVTKYMDSSGVALEGRKTANGTEIFTYPCILKEISLDGTVIENFKFGLVPQINSDRFLIGDDFLCCCAYTHEVGGNIKISDFNSVRYDKLQNDIKFASFEKILDKFSKTS